MNRLCTYASVLAVILTLLYAVGQAKADTRQANVSKCYADRGVPVQSAASPNSVVCIAPVGGKVLWVR